MTIKDAILSVVPDAKIVDKVCIDQGLTATDDYTSDATLKAKVDVATAYSMIAFANKPDYSQGKMSLTIPRGQLIAEANRILKNNGVDISEPSITDRSDLW